MRLKIINTIKLLYLKTPLLLHTTMGSKQLHFLNTCIIMALQHGSMIILLSDHLQNEAKNMNLQYSKYSKFI